MGKTEMAKPVPTIVKGSQISSSNGVREGLQRELAKAPVEHAEALLSAYELIQTLHDRGVLDILRGLAGAGDDIVGRIAAGLNSPEVIRAIRNLLALAQAIGSVDPRVFESFRQAAADTASKSVSPESKPPGMWTIFKRAESEDSRRALSAITGFLESFGRQLKNSSDGEPR